MYVLVEIFCVLLVGHYGLSRNIEVKLRQPLEKCNLPNYINNDLEVTWTVMGPPRSRVILSCSNLDLPLSETKDESCMKASLKIDNGKEKQRLCGHRSNFKIESVGRWMTLKLQRKGENVQTESGGLFRSASYSYVPFKARVECTVQLNQFVPVKPVTCECGRIVPGLKKPEYMRDVEEFSFLAYLRAEGTDRLFTGGSILTQRHILTAASCLEDMSASDLKVVVGGLNDRTNMQRLTVSEIVRHQSYRRNVSSGGLPTDNTAILQLIDMIQFNDYVRPICFFKRFPSNYLKLRDLVSFGKVNMDPNGTASLIPTVRTIDRYQPLWGPHQKKLGDNQFATVSYKHPVFVGFPLIVFDEVIERYVQVGIQSGDWRHQRQSYFTHMYLPQYFSWIQETLRNLSWQNGTCNREPEYEKF